MDQKEYRTLILAGLLHDVGKLLIEDPDERETARKLTGSGSKRTSAHHWVLGEDFLRREGIAGPLSQFEIDFEELCFAVRWHHYYFESTRAAEALERAGDRAAAYARMRDCIAEGDGLSSGERSKRVPKSEQETIEFALGLQSIFADLDLGREPAGHMLRYPPAALTPRVAFPAEFPAGAGRAARTHREEAYKRLVAEFREGFRHVVANAEDVGELEAWIYSLLERYAWAAPSDMRPRAEPRDVSLFDHERTTCALAAAVYLWQQLALEEERERPRFLFIKGDVSGVQDYIYTVANIGPGGVAKRLRARSFFVTALTEVVAHRLREELVPGYTLPIAAQIFAGGGQFVLLAPNLEVVHEKLDVIDHDVNAWLWAELQGDLAFVFGAVGATGSDLGIGPGRSICDVLDELDDRVEEAKGQRLGVLLKDKGGWNEGAFTWKAKPYPNGDCPSCRRLPAQAGQAAPVDDQLCERCFRDRVLSERIVDAKYIAYYRGAGPPAVKAGTPGRDAARLRGGTLALFEGDAGRHVVLLKTLDDRARLEGQPYQLDGFGYERPTPKGPALVRHFANHVPEWNSLDELKEFCTAGRGCVEDSYDNDEACGILVRPDGSRVRKEDYPILRTFGCISAAAAEWPDGALGTQLLGVLRADADRMGRLRSLGFARRKSLSRVATLSRMTDLFFSGWVNETLKEPPESKRYNLIYTVYSGGDDLCLVGPWDVIVDFSRHLAAEFQRYVAGNPNVTLSAAIAVTKPKFPIATSASKAGDWLEDRAKEEGRNRLHLFGVTARWRDLPDYRAQLRPEVKEMVAEERKEKEALLLDDLWEWAELLDEELERWREAKPARYPVSTGFAHRLLGYAEMARRWEQEEQISTEDMLYLARLAYDLGRNVKESDAVSEETKHKLNRLTQLANREVMAAMRLPITFALYRNRERSRER